MLSHNYDDKVVIPSAIKSATMDMLSDEESRIITQQPANPNTIYHDAPVIDLDLYERIIVMMSSGKDSLACLLTLIDQGVDLSKVELVHHNVDGHFDADLFADWAYVTDYNRAIARHFNLPIYFSWLDGGFKKELLKDNARSANHTIETPNGWLNLDRPLVKPNTRRRFPQQTANQMVRWCSGTLKTTVGDRMITSQDRFLGGMMNRTLIVVGQRREESSARKRLSQFVVHSTDTSRKESARKLRYVDEWRPVLHMTEEQVWALLEKHSIIPPVAYRLGWGRSSCQICIFSSAKLWATMAYYFPERFREVADLEEEFGVSISQSRTFLRKLVQGVAPLNIQDEEALIQATEKEYRLPITTSHWKLPAGAFNAESAGAI